MNKSSFNCRKLHHTNRAPSESEIWNDNWTRNTRLLDQENEDFIANYSLIFAEQK